MTDVENLLRSVMSDRAASAPAAHDLAGAARARARRQRRRRAQLAGGILAVTATLAAGGFLVAQSTRSDPVGPVTTPSPSPTDTPILLPTLDEPSEGGQEVGLSGVLTVGPDGCLYAANEHRPAELTSLIWPYGYTARRNAEGMVEVLDAGGAVVLREGDLFMAGGGWAPAPGKPCVRDESPFWMIWPPRRLID